MCGGGAGGDLLRVPYLPLSLTLPKAAPNPLQASAWLVTKSKQSLPCVLPIFTVEQTVVFSVTLLLSSELVTCYRSEKQ